LGYRMRRAEVGGQPRGQVMAASQQWTRAPDFLARNEDVRGMCGTGTSVCQGEVCCEGCEVCCEGCEVCCEELWFPNWNYPRVAEGRSDQRNSSVKVNETTLKL
jgi:hypothetical protein